MNKEDAVRGITALLGILGTLLAIADQIKAIPALAAYSNYAVATIGVAVVVKQAAMIIYEKLTGKKWNDTPTP